MHILQLQQKVDFLTTNPKILDLIFTSRGIDIQSLMDASEPGNLKSDDKPILATILIKNDKIITFREDPQHIFSFCFGYLFLNDLIGHATFLPYCWTNIDLMVENCYKWLKEKMENLIPIRTKQSLIASLDKLLHTKFTKQMQYCLSQTVNHSR